MSGLSAIEELSHTTANEYMLPKYFDYGSSEFQQLSNIELLRSDCATGLSVSASGQSVFGTRGYRSVRASHGISEGSMYFEVYIHPHAVHEVHADTVPDEAFINPASVTRLTQSQLFRPNSVAQDRHVPAVETPHVRVGFATAAENVHFPVGTGQGSFGIRSIDGHKGTLGIWEEYSCNEAFHPGDVIGCFLHMGQEEPQSIQEESTVPTAAEVFLAAMNEQVLHTFPTNTNLHSMYGNESSTAILKKDSFISFYKNGVSQGTAFTQVPQTVQFPMVSLYNESCVSVNFGPDWAFPPTEVVYPCLARVATVFIQPSDVCINPVYAWQHCKLAFLRQLLRNTTPEQTKETRVGKKTVLLKGEVQTADLAHLVVEHKEVAVSALPPTLLPLLSSNQETGVLEDYLPTEALSVLSSDLVSELRRLCLAAKEERDNVQCSYEQMRRYSFDHIIKFDQEYKLLRRVIVSKLLTKKTEKKKPTLKRKRKEQPSLQAEIEQALVFKPAVQEPQPDTLLVAPKVVTIAEAAVPTLRLRDQGWLYPNPLLEAQEPVLLVAASGPQTSLVKMAPMEDK